MDNKKQNLTVYDLVNRERNLISLWLIYHLMVFITIGMNVFFAYKYMLMPDRVLVLGRDRNIYIGNSAPVESGLVLEDVALRAAYAVLARRYDDRNERALEMVFTKRGRGQAKSYLSSTHEMFKERRLFQEIDSCEVQYSWNDGQYFALVKGVLRRNGMYFGHSYTQMRDFALMMRLERSANDNELPFKVAGMKFYEEEAENE